MKKAIQTYLSKQVDAAPLAVFRILFGGVMLWSMLRFWANGWIEKLYIEPQFFFSYYGFEWVKPLGEATYLLFVIASLASIGVMLGFKYRLSIITLFLSFTYIELMDKTTYLNHYYFISLLTFVMIFLPANTFYSVDAYLNQRKRFRLIPAWTIDSIKLLLAMVWFFAGLAKLNSDWLFRAMPLKIWLPAKYDIPVLGQLLQQEWVHYAFSWSGALYDLTIPFLLLFPRTRKFGFVLVVVFHLLTRIIFPIGMFPYIMILSSLIFFSSALHNRILDNMTRILRLPKVIYERSRTYAFMSPIKRQAILALFAGFFMIQAALPFRHVLYPGELFWTEQGFRFSWRVMLMEKAGYAQFKIKDPDTGRSFFINNGDHLHAFQEKQMAFQPDFILEYAHYLDEVYRQKGIRDPEVYVESYVALNGRQSRQFIDPNVDLSIVQPSFKPKNWILPFGDDIKGL